jgi:hypothetical protein
MFAALNHASLRRVVKRANTKGRVAGALFGARET